MRKFSRGEGGHSWFPELTNHRIQTKFVFMHSFLGTSRISCANRLLDVFVQTVCLRIYPIRAITSIQTSRDQEPPKKRTGNEVPEASVNRVDGLRFHHPASTQPDYQEGMVAQASRPASSSPVQHSSYSRGS